MNWDPEFSDRSPMLEVVRALGLPLRAMHQWPTRDELNAVLRDRGVSTARGQPLTLGAPDAAFPSYEARIHETGVLAHREENWHDVMNVLAWLAWPRTKAALNAAHYRELRSGSGQTASGRGRRRDALTLFDESGVVVASDDLELLDALRGFAWDRLFVEWRARTTERLHVSVIGHGLLEKALAPYLGLTGHALLLPLESGATPDREALDKHAAHAVESLAHPRELAPLPVLGIPGWWAANEDPAFYENSAYFRLGRRSGK